MPKKAILQGKLDGLCGLYSVINAINNVLPPKVANDDLRSKLFKIGIEHIDKQEKRLKKTILNGMKINILKQILKACIEHINKKHGYSLKVTIIAKNNSKIPVFKKEIVSFLRNNKKSVVIVGLGGYDHWSVVRKVTKDEWHMIDSDYIKRVKKDQLTTAQLPNKIKSITIHHGEVIGLYFDK